MFLKPCDTYSFNQLIKEHRVDREKAYIIGIGCKGKLDIEKIKKMGIKGIESIQGAEAEDACDTLKIQTIYGEKTCSYKDAMLERCHVCKGKEHQIYDELLGESKDTKDADRFAEVERIEAMSPEEKFAFFQKELSKCIRCNACRNVCPACSCRKCVFDSNKFDSSQKANADSFEEKCSILSVPSMWQEDVPTAASAAEYVRRGFPFICLTESLSKTLICFTESIRQERMLSQKVRLQVLLLMMQSRAVCEKGDKVCIR